MHRRILNLGMMTLLSGLVAMQNAGAAEDAPKNTRKVPRKEMPAQVDDAARFGSMEAVPQGHPPLSNNMADQAGAPAMNQSQPMTKFEYSLPPGWRSVEPTSFRNVNLVFGSTETGECYVTLLSGRGGTVSANVNRWREQMGLAALSEAEISELPTVEVLGSPAVYVEMAGAFSGMAGQTQIKDAMLLGVVTQLNSKGLFVKMVGPAGLVKAERKNFGAFLSSLRAVEGSTSGSLMIDPNAPLPPGHPNIDPHSLITGADGLSSSSMDMHSMQADIGTTSQPVVYPAGKKGASELEWTAPAGWKTKPAAKMRAVSFSVPGEKGEGDCGVFKLPGTAGGVVANINRWRAQMGMEGLAPGELEKFPETDIAGRKGKLVELRGQYRGMGAQATPNSTLLGVICEVDDGTLFVKLTGPDETVAAARNDFLGLCRDLKVSKN